MKWQLFGHGVTPWKYDLKKAVAWKYDLKKAVAWKYNLKKAVEWKYDVWEAVDPRGPTKTEEYPGSTIYGRL